MTPVGRGAPSVVRELWDGRRTAGTAVAAAVTAPLSALFWSGVRLRSLAYRAGVLRSERASIPVVSVGNLAVGGTGKTPVARWIAEALADRGWHPALVVRGYGEDEIRLHRRWNLDIPVIVAPRRIEGVRDAAARGCTVAVLDDGFQHRQIAGDLDIVLLSAGHQPPFRVLPRGPFREPPGALRRSDHVLVTAKGTAERPAARGLVEYARRIVGNVPVDLFPLSAAEWRTLDGAPSAAPPGSPLMVCSIAEPGGFATLVQESLGEATPGGLELVAFPDHHPYSAEACVGLAARAAGRWLATTEKDAVKLAEWEELLPSVRVLPLEPRPDPGLAEQLVAHLPDPPSRNRP